MKAEGNSNVDQLLERTAKSRIAGNPGNPDSDKSRSHTGRDQIALDRSLVNKLYLATLSRDPGIREVRIAMGELERDRKKGLENLQWALLNSPEFLFNY